MTTTTLTRRFFLKTATAAVRKDTTLFQPDQDTRARWPAAKPKFRKR